MVEENLEQTGAIEKNAFPNLFPSTAFVKELKRNRSTYFVAGLDQSNPKASNILPNQWHTYKSDNALGPNNNVY